MQSSSRENRQATRVFNTIFLKCKTQSSSRENCPKSKNEMQTCEGRNCQATNEMQTRSSFEGSLAMSIIVLTSGGKVSIIKVNRTPTQTPPLTGKAQAMCGGRKMSEIQFVGPKICLPPPKETDCSFKMHEFSPEMENRLP
jgi:hypothetical protein